MKVCVIGAGIVGLASARALSLVGHDVVVVDSAPSVGAGASFGNGAQLSYSYVQPLAEPAVLCNLPKWLLSASSPLRFGLRLDAAQWLWCARFLAACTASRSRATTATLLSLAALSRHEFDAWYGQTLVACDHRQSGKLVIYPTVAELAAATSQVRLQAKLGSTQSVVSVAACIDIEPTLHTCRDQFSGGVYTPDECAADCLKVCNVLEQQLRALPHTAVEFRLGETLERLYFDGNRIARVVTSAGEIAADCFVIAAGADSARIGRMARTRLPVYPLKGYSITLDTRGYAGAPSVSVTDMRRKVVFARLGDRLRVAGMVELVGHDRSVDATRIHELAEATRLLFGECASFEQLNPWAGLRPATPTSVPIVGQLGPPNLHVNVGHGALGFTLAFGTAKLLADGIS